MPSRTPQRFPPPRTFHALSFRDVLDAREAYHVHLASLDNVVGTAIALHRFRKTELDDGSAPRTPRRSIADREPRTFDNSAITRRSWPALLVIVSDWATPTTLRDRPDQLVPPLLHLPDGRVVPTCVVTARPDPTPEQPLERVAFASDLLGGGYPVMSEAQGVEQIGTLGCLVADGRLVHALTARHVCGRSGEPLYTVVRGSRELIGVSHDVQAGKLADRDSTTLTNLDAGLVRIDDLTRWSAQVFGIGELGEPIDLHDRNLTLDLIGCPLRAFGGVSGVLEGEIHGLLYRYHHIGGAALQTDLLIGPRTDRGPLATRPGDSGTLWCFDPTSRRVTDDDSDNVHPWLDAPPAQRGAHARRLRPVAMQWGGARLSDSDGHPARFALGTFLSTICRRLDVEVVTGWNVGHGEYWGKTAHFKIGAKACELVTTPALRQLLELNRTRIGFGDDVLSLGTEFRVGRGKYVPLADVPDYVWIAQARGGTEARAAEASQHFADLDEPGFAPFAGTTLLELCTRNAKNLDPAVWARFYDSFPPDAAPERGALPFRIWQIYDSMVDAVRRKDMLWFVAAAGVLAHYVGDACQPLHVSRLHHGRAPRRGTPEYDAYKKTPQYKIHSVFEQVMFAVCATEMLAAINARLTSPVKLKRIRGGR